MFVQWVVCFTYKFLVKEYFHQNVFNTSAKMAAAGVISQAMVLVLLQSLSGFTALFNVNLSINYANVRITNSI